MAPRVDGTKLVIAAVAATLTAVGIGTIYVPFFADRDKLRGLHEEADGGLSGNEKQAYEQYLRHIQEARGEQHGVPGGDADQLQRKKSLPSGNSMWSRINQAASGKK